MLDLSYAREADVDVDEPIAIPRVRTEDLTVHVKLDTGWHKQDADGLETNCGDHINVRLQLETRNERQPLRHPLATLRSDGQPCDCWTRKERTKADTLYRKEFGREFRP